MTITCIECGRVMQPPTIGGEHELLLYRCVCGAKQTIALQDVQRMRIAAGLTPSQAAKLVGCGPRHINAHERGEHAPRIDVLINYTRAYRGSLLAFERAVERVLAGQEP